MRPKGSICRSPIRIKRIINMQNNRITKALPKNPHSSPTVQKNKIGTLFGNEIEFGLCSFQKSPCPQNRLNRLQFSTD